MKARESRIEGGNMTTRDCLQTYGINLGFRVALCILIYLSLTMASLSNNSIHWFEPRNIPSEYLGGRVGVYIGALVHDDTFEDTVYEIECMGRCKRDIYPLGQIVDEGRTPHYAFIVHPRIPRDFPVRCAVPDVADYWGGPWTKPDITGSP